MKKEKGFLTEEKRCQRKRSDVKKKGSSIEKRKNRPPNELWTIVREG